MARKTNPIRVGLIRCDRRALWYGAIFDQIDPEAYSRLDPPAYHHFTWYKFRELKHKRASGFRLTRVYDVDASAARQLATTFGDRPHVCDRLDEVSDDVDLVFIANETGDGKDHLKLARPGLEKGVATFIDRPLSATVKDARAILTLAKKHKAPLLSCSHMEMLPHAAWFKARYREIGPVEVGNVQGHGPNPADIADGIALAMYLFGDDFAGRVDTVQSMGTWPLELLHLRYGSDPEGRVLQALVVNSHTSATRNAFAASAYSHRTPIYVDDLNSFVQPEGGLAVMNAIKKMLKTGNSPISPEAMIEPIAVTEAGRKSHNRAKPLAIAKLR